MSGIVYIANKVLMAHTHTHAWYGYIVDRKILFMLFVFVCV